MPGPQIPSEKEIEQYLTTDNNWGRWGKDDQMGAMNFLTPEKVAFMTNFAKIKKSFISIQGNQKCLEALCFFQSQAIFIESTEELGEQLIDI